MGAVWGEVLSICFNWKLKFLDKGGSQKAIWPRPCSQPGPNEEGRVEMRGLWRASNEERSQKTPAEPR